MGVKININGETYAFERSLTLLDLLEKLAVHPGCVVVERNRNIIRKKSLEAVAIEDGDELEIIRFVGGG